MKRKAIKLYSTTLLVKPMRKFARFPIDMLRYDNCVPASERDAGLIEKYGHQRSIERDDHAEYFVNFESWKNRHINQALGKGASGKQIEELIKKIDAGTYEHIPFPIKLTMLGYDPKSMPNTDRWQSFGWDVQVIQEF